MNKLDARDIKILSIVQRGERITKTALARRVNPSPTPCWQRLRHLERAGIIESYDARISSSALGTMFGSVHYGIRPDIIAVAKGLTSAYAPLSGSIIVDKVWEVLEQGTDEIGPIGHGWTYSAHPLGAAAGIANLRVIDELGLVANAAEVGAYFNQAMQNAVGDHPHVGEARGDGLLSAIEFVDEEVTRKLYDPVGKVGPQVAAALLQRGVIARAMPHGDILGFAPPLCLTQQEAEAIVEATKAATEGVLGT